MPADWIKMRTDLYRDPKVCMMADFLLDEDGDLARYVNQNCQRDMTVTRNVTRNAIIGALVTVWGVTRHRGKRDGDDLVVRGATVTVVDDIADLPGLGEAMQRVGWLVSGETSLVFPRFFEEFNSDPTESLSEKAAERQRRYRERKKLNSNVTRDVTNTSHSNGRVEKSRVESTSSKEDVTATVPDDLMVQLGFADEWKHYKDHRKKLRAPMTEHAAQLILNELAKRPAQAVEGLEMAQAQGWTGFKWAWVDNQKQRDAKKDATAPRKLPPPNMGY